ncbi:MAG TPA: DsrE family protein [Chitinophagaceae bacterium]|nr:DsrE family protein [Chitinophagaceae bacterium]
MRKQLFCLLFLMPILAAAQSDYKVVFDLTSRDSMDHKALLRWVGGIAQTEPQAQLEVVMYGQGVHMARRGGSPVESTVLKLLQSKNVRFKVCGVALKNQGIAGNELLPGIETVSDGIYEIIQRQKQGWGYIKAGL